MKYRLYGWSMVTYETNPCRKEHAILYVLSLYTKLQFDQILGLRYPGPFFVSCREQFGFQFSLVIMLTLSATGNPSFERSRPPQMEIFMCLKEERTPFCHYKDKSISPLAWWFRSAIDRSLCGVEWTSWSPQSKAFIRDSGPGAVPCWLLPPKLT